ncbi:MAG: cell filamentation protein Fic [Bacteroidetes bacterium]|nr:MAG: cell filamentation protein Fic [Bacteroidota bacterium]
MVKKKPDKYLIPGEELEVLPNLLGIVNPQEIGRQEFIGFIKAQEYCIDRLEIETRFTLVYLLAIHKKALGRLYSFAGKLRTVNMSRGGFAFPAAHVLPQAMVIFESQMLQPLNNPFMESPEFIRCLARMHAELLYLHPFREGNGRTVRLFTNLISLKNCGVEVDFHLILENHKSAYIQAIQQSVVEDYSLMEELFSLALPF